LARSEWEHWQARVSHHLTKHSRWRQLLDQLQQAAAVARVVAVAEAEAGAVMVVVVVAAVVAAVVAVGDNLRTDRTL
jgi:hypothetical protein